MFISCVFYRFPIVLEWILGGLGKVLEVLFRAIFKKLKFEKTAFPLKKIDKFKSLSHEKINGENVEIN